jgi:multidrug resistance efflux pump
MASANGNSAQRAYALHEAKTRTASNDVLPHAEIKVAPSAPVVAPARDEAVRTGNSQPQISPSGLNGRQIVFRCVRLTLAGVLVSSAAMYARTVFTTARSEMAYINAEITTLRAPIAGQVRLEPIGSGRAVAAGSALFTVENARFGNEQALAQLNWAQQSAEQLQAESEEAVVRLRHQEEVTRIHEKMFSEQVIPRLQLIEERSKRDLASAVLSNKAFLAAKAAARVAELTRQVELQHTAAVAMPFAGVPWTTSAKNGAQLAVNEPVVEVINPAQMWVDAFFAERHSSKLAIGAEVDVKTPRGEVIGRGHIESVRAGVGRIPFEGVAAVSPSEYTAQRVAARVRLDSMTPFPASEFFGVGRGVVVTLKAHD